MKTLVSATALLMLAGTAFADAPKTDKKPEPPKAPDTAKHDDKAGGHDAAPMPKPAPELQQLKGMVGTWNCDGKVTMGGHEMPEKSTYTVAWDMDNFWLVGKIDAPAMKFHAVDYYNYDPSEKKFIMASLDNMGGWGMSHSDGYKGDKQEWDGHAMMMGHAVDTHMSITRHGDKQVMLEGKTMAGKDVVSTMSMTCNMK